MNEVEALFFATGFIDHVKLMADWRNGKPTDKQIEITQQTGMTLQVKEDGT